MKKFSNQDVADYYDHSEVHYKMFWRLEEGLGLHYGIWDSNVKNLPDAILNTNRRLMEMGEIKKEDYILDAGCGVGGSSIFITKNIGSKIHGISLSERQIKSATLNAQKHGQSDKIAFSTQDYTRTNFDNNTFNKVWAIESMQTAFDKSSFFKEMHRVLKPGGKILIADIFKIKPYDISEDKGMQTMLHGWAMSDILSVDELKELAAKHGFKVAKISDVSLQIEKSVNMVYWASFIGMFGTIIYNVFHKATHFSKVHYKTGLAQKATFEQKKWGYLLLVLEKVD